MNLVEKMLDGVQSLMNVNSATFSGAVDIIVVPQEDGTLACTSWHVRFGKLQLLNTTEKKIHVTVNDTEIKGLKMRLGRAGEGYFVAETVEKPPPEFQASIDPEHGLSDDEAYDLDRRATHDDWTIQDDKAERAMAIEADPPVEGDWADPNWNPSDVAAHARHLSGDHLRVTEAEAGKSSLRNSSSAHSVLSSHDPTLSPKSSGSSKERYIPSSPTGRHSKQSSTDGKLSEQSSTPPPPLDLASSSMDSSAHDPLTSSDPALDSIVIQASRESAANGGKHLSASTASPSASKPHKSWGAALFSFLGKKDQSEGLHTEEGATDTKSKTGNASSAVPIASAPRRTSLDLEDAQKKLHGDEIYGSPMTLEVKSDGRAIQSSSLPNHWGPSPLLSHTPSSSSFKSNVEEDPYISDGGTRHLAAGFEDERSRAAEDGSGVIFVGQKRKPRSSSITAATLGKSRSASPTPSLETPPSNLSSAASKPTSPVPQSQSTTDIPSNSTSPSAIELRTSAKSLERGSGSAIQVTSSSTKQNNTSAPASAPDSDSEYQDMVFEMDEEAYHAANPSGSASTSLPNLIGAVAGSPSPAGGPGTAQSPSAVPAGTANAMGTALGSIEVSRCGMNAVATHDSNPTGALEAFNATKLTWQSLNDDPNILFSPDAVFRISGTYYPFTIAAPMLFSVALFNAPLSSQSVDRLITQTKPKSSKWERWFPWRKHDGAAVASSSSSAASSSNFITSSLSSSNLGPESATGASGNSTHSKRGSLPSNVNGGSSNAASPSVSRSAIGGASGRENFESGQEEPTYVNATGVISPRTSVHRTRTASKIAIGGKNTGSAGGGGSSGVNLTESGEYSSSTGANAGHSHGSTGTVGGGANHGVYYIRTLKPTSEKLKAMNLQPGPNKVVFSVDSRLQGVQQVTSTIYLWDRDSKVVISDIDGTITKSDVLGQLFPVFGKDWSHFGVAALFQNIKANGYEILYLTARAIGAASITKGFLTSLQQDNVHLPDGPVFMSPDRLLHSLNREVILRRPEEFKIQCLTEIQSLFTGGSLPSSSSSSGARSKPFYAGFGNRETDALSYVAVGIPVGKTFTINPSGEITGHSRSIQRTYTKIHQLAEQMFPPYHKKRTSNSKQSASEQWNDFQYWETRPSSGYSLEDVEKELLN